MKDYLEGLNYAQYNAVTTNEKYARVIAGAGSGKTRVLTSRIAYLIDKMNVFSQRILAFTFTNKAANEMKKRVETTLEIEKCGSNISTFHSFCSRFLRQEISHICFTKSFTILDEQDQEDIIKELKKEYDEFKQVKPSQIIGYISYCKTYDIKPESINPNEIIDVATRIKAQTYVDYCAYLKKFNYCDFDDLIIYTVDILSKNEAIKKKWSNKFDHILVDEFQDTDNLQYKLLKLLCKEDTNVFVVGDPDQTIYTWRGANVDIIVHFDKDFKGSVDYILNTNYRSTEPILELSNALINHNKKRLKKDLISNNKTGSVPLCFGATSQEKEAEWIGKKIYDSVNTYNLKYSDFAVLYRSNYYSGMIEKSLINLRIPYEIYGGIKFYERKEIKDCMCYLRLIINDDDIIAFNRIINVPRRGIGDKTLSEMHLNAKLNNMSVYNYVKDNLKDYNTATKEFIDVIEKYKSKLKEENVNYRNYFISFAEDIGYFEMLDPVEDEDRIDNIRELGNILFNSQLKNPEISLEEIIQELSLYSAQDTIKDENVVKLMTVHTAKGLEFPYVFVAGLSNGVFPNQRSLNVENSKDALEEERRLCYVAFTRAKQNLFLSYNTGFTYMASNNEVSIFINEIKDHIKYDIINPDYSTKSTYKPHIDIDIGKINEDAVDNSTMSETVQDFRPGSIVIHNKYGEGIILSVDENSFKIAFKDVNYGVKEISRKFTGLKRK